MAIVGLAKEIAEGTEANISIGGHRQRDKVYLVRTDATTDGSAAVQLAPGLPQIGDSYGEIDIGCCCINLIPIRKQRFVWHVTVVYSTEYESLSNILSEPPEVDFPSESGERPILGQMAPSAPYPPPDPGQQTDPNKTQTIVYLQGSKGIVNSAGNIYDPPATRRASTPLFYFTRNERTFSLTYKVQFEDTVNAVAWNGLTARQAYCRLVNAQAQYYQPPTISQSRLLFWKVRYEFALKYETWDLILPDAGPFYLEYNGSTAYRKPFLTPDGTPYIGLLDHTTDTAKPGQKLAAGADCQYLRWRVNRETNFSQMNINVDLTLQNLTTSSRSAKSIIDPSKTPVSVA